MWEIGRQQGHYGDHPHPQVADRGMPSRVDKRVALDREGAVDKQCQGEGKLWSQYVITNCEEGQGKPTWLYRKTGYPSGYPEPALQQKTEERERERLPLKMVHSGLVHFRTILGFHVDCGGLYVEWGLKMQGPLYPLTNGQRTCGCLEIIQKVLASICNHQSAYQV